MKTKKKKLSKTAKKGAKAKSKAKPKKKAAVKARGKGKKLTARPAAKKKSKGLSVVDLFHLKEQQAQEHHPMNDDWKHKKSLPPQEQHNKETMRSKNNANGKRSGFGGVRHH